MCGQTLLFIVIANGAIGTSLSLHFNSHFLGGPGLAATRMSLFWTLLELRLVVTTGAI